MEMLAQLSYGPSAAAAVAALPPAALPVEAGAEFEAEAGDHPPTTRPSYLAESDTIHPNQGNPSPSLHSLSSIHHAKSLVEHVGDDDMDDIADSLVPPPGPEPGHRSRSSEPDGEGKMGEARWQGQGQGSGLPEGEGEDLEVGIGIALDHHMPCNRN